MPTSVATSASSFHSADLLAVFNTLPGAYLLLSPALVIEAASDAYLAATLTSRARLVGQHLFDAFPDNPLTPQAHSVRNLRASLRQVLATGQPHQMAPQHYDVPDPDRPGQFVERHWEPLNTPVLDDQGAVVRIIHSARDTTAEVQNQEYLRASRAAEQTALAAAERQQALLYRVFEEAPAMICILQGPEHVFEFANAPYRALMGGRPLVGRRFAEALPELAGQGILEPLNEVYRSGEAFYASEQPAQLDHTNTNRSPAELEQRYYNLVWQARRDGAGAVDGVLVFAYDVTPQVLARRQVQALNEELAARNAALRTSNNEYQHANAALADAQHQLQQLNQELETRVQARTREALALQTELLAAAQRQADERETFYQVFAQTTAMVALLRGPDHRYEYANTAYQAIFPGCPLVGHAVAEVVPELFTQGFGELFDHVYQTGETCFGTEIPFVFAEAVPRTAYYNFTYQAYREAGQVVGVSVFAYDVTEQVLARREREAQQLLLAAIFEQAPVAIAILHGPHYVVELANSALGAIWGRTPAQARGQRLFELVPEAAGRGFEEQFEQVRATGEAITTRELPTYADREGRRDLRYWNFVYAPLPEADGTVERIMVLATEVTAQVLARRQVEQLNEELEARVAERTQQLEAARTEAERQRGELERVLEQAPVAIAVYRGPAYTIELANPTVARLWGRTRAQLLGKGLFEALPEVAGMGYEQLLDEVMATGVPYVAHAMEAQHDRNGQRETVYWDFVYVPMPAADGRGNGVMVVATEVTAQVLARRQMEQLNEELEARVRARTQEVALALAEAERQRQHLNELVQQAPAAMCVVGGPDFSYETFNPLYAAMFGGRPRVGRPMGEVLPEVVNHPGFLAIRAVYEEGRTFRQDEVLVPLARPGDGVLEDRYFSYTQQPRYASQGQVDGIFVFAVEVTDQVRARQQVQDLNQELAAANQDLHASNRQLTRTNVDLDTFVYTASHDLKAPITNIEGILAALRETLPPEVQTDEVVAHLLGLLDNTVGRFLTTIDQLTDLSRLQRTYDAPAERLALSLVVAGVVADLAPLIEAAAAQVQLDVPADLHVSFAPASLRSIVYNLLSNAIKYRDPARPAQVWLRTESRPDAVVLSVQDNGLGLSESQQGRLFGVFQRLHTHVDGTGVGLYMIKRLIENAGARIAVTSAVGVGSTFTVTFPT